MSLSDSVKDRWVAIRYRRAEFRITNCTVFYNPDDGLVITDDDEGVIRLAGFEHRGRVTIVGCDFWADRDIERGTLVIRPDRTAR